MSSGASPDHLPLAATAVPIAPVVPGAAVEPGAPVEPDRPPRPRRPAWPDSVHVVPWHDPLVDRHGHDPRSPYVETFWLPVLGPSTVLLLRRLAGLLDAAPDGFDLDLDDTAAALGLGGRTGRHAPFQRTLERCLAFAVAERVGDTLAVRRHLPPLARRHLVRLPSSLQDCHELAVAARREQTGRAGVPAVGDDPRSADASTGPAPAPPGPADPRVRARQLALSLLRMGEDAPAVARHLARWGVHPAATHDAVTWAVARERDPSAQGTAPAGTPAAAPCAPVPATGVAGK